VSKNPLIAFVDKYGPKAGELGPELFVREVLGVEPLKLLCTQRTEPHGMSSTALRRMRSKK